MSDDVFKLLTITRDEEGYVAIVSDLDEPETLWLLETAKQMLMFPDWFETKESKGA